MFLFLLEFNLSQEKFLMSSSFFCGQNWKRWWNSLKIKTFYENTKFSNKYFNIKKTDLKKPENWKSSEQIKRLFFSPKFFIQM